MKADYISTIKAEIPEGWSTVKLKDIVSDFIVPMRDKPKSFEGNVPWCRIEDFNGIYLSKSKSGRSVSTETIKAMNLKVYPVGTVLVSCSADLGRCAITATPLVTNQTFIGLYPKKNIAKEFLYYKMINSAKKLNKLSSGTTIAYLSREQFENFSIVLPTFPEQQKIAEILSTLDEKIEVISEQIEQTQELKKGLMQRLLTKGIGHTQFKDSPLGQIPESWETAKLGNHASLMTNGFVGSATPFYVEEDGITYIQGYNVKENKFRFKGIKSVSKAFHEKQKKSHLREGDLLTVQSGHIGTTAVVPKTLEGANCHALIITRLDTTHLIPDFVAFFINSPLGKEKINVISVGSTILHVNVKDFMKFIVPKPPITEQQRIVEVFSLVDEKLDTLSKKEVHYQELKKGLMQQLMNGKLRVNHLIEVPELA